MGPRVPALNLDRATLMCWSCVEDYMAAEGREVDWESGATPPVRLDLRELMIEVTQWYRWHPTGGPLHIVLDDSNVEDGALDFCELELTSRTLWDRERRTWGERVPLGDPRLDLTQDYNRPLPPDQLALGRLIIARFRAIDSLADRALVTVAHV